MYVRNHMLPKDKLITVQLKENVKSALDKIIEGDFLSLPVLDGDEFKGIIMKEAIYRTYFEGNYDDREKFLLNTTVEELYNDEYKSIKEYELIENASYLLKELRTPFLPVFDKRGNFVGILTHFAIFNAFAEIFGFDKGTRIVVYMFDIPGQLAKLTEVLKKEDINILNFAVMDAKVLGVYKVVLRVDTENVERLIDKIEKAGFKVGDIVK
ncbi:acetoin utilization protein AcuB [Keratinibaculum paraultunense]|uniref:Acetoin utilization protein AcuB n=1 Tax=Keratinibaculum paraultunense TaxID=1278232 RepID=A0A4R3KVL9_9FIRM|nr:CBS domain-containing protein [Keratinibaculum paraultunense]QQY78768.1 CBS domain-containing protein [Keratinibaculum paraultunense]TCS89547.1 acetoin utilization protein AcuB [Keratinibaculum paraultunense]